MLPVHLANGVLGGALIGLSAGAMLLFNGDVMGASGIISSLLLSPRKLLSESSQAWRITFLAGLALSTKMYLHVVGDLVLSESVLHTVTLKPIGYVIAGFLVGFGTRLSNGCTSGHGICGLARFSKRSFYATLTFMASGALSASLFSPLLRLPSSTPSEIAFPTETTRLIGTALTSIIAIMFVPVVARAWLHRPRPGAADYHKECNAAAKLFPAMACGSLFALGLIKSGMIYPSRVSNFLRVSNGLSEWDPTLAFVMAGGLSVSALAYHYVKGHGYTCSPDALDCPLSQKNGNHPPSDKGSSNFNVPTNANIDRRLILGAVLFGFGWGLGGICPGPAMVQLVHGYPSVLLQWWPGYMLGAHLGQILVDRKTL